jgi:hypothetical protein
MFRFLALPAALLATACSTVTVTQQSNAVGGGRPALAANVASRPAAPGATPQAAPSARPVPPNGRPAPVRASDASLGGSVPEVNLSYTGSVELLGRRIPLPAGEWTVVARDFSTDKVDPPSVDIAFVRSEGHRITGLLSIYGTPLGRPAPAGFKVNTACTASDVILNEVAAESPGGVQDCLNVRWLRPVIYHDIRSSAFVHNIAAALDARDIGLPAVMVGAEAYEADRGHELRFAAFFNPDAAGITPDLSVQRGQSGWAPYNLPKDPQKAAYVERVRNWGEAWRPALRQLLSSRTVTASAEMQATP